MTMVKIQLRKVLRKNCLLSPANPSHSATPTIPPVMHCELEVGRPYWLATRMTSDVLSSAAKPRLGVSFAMRVPMARVTCANVKTDQHFHTY